MNSRGNEKPQFVRPLEQANVRRNAIVQGSFALLTKVKPLRDVDIEMFVSHADKDHFAAARHIEEFLKKTRDLLPERFDPREQYSIEHLFDIPHASQGPPLPEVPALGEKILNYVCSSDHLEDILGHLEERFRNVAETRGVKSARRWYWWQVTRSVSAFALNLLTRVASMWELLKKFGL